MKNLHASYLPFLPHGTTMHRAPSKSVGVRNSSKLEYDCLVFLSTLAHSRCLGLGSTGHKSFDVAYFLPFEHANGSIKLPI